MPANGTLVSDPFQSPRKRSSPHDFVLLRHPITAVAVSDQNFAARVGVEGLALAARVAATMRRRVLPTERAIVVDDTGCVVQCARGVRL